MKALHSCSLISVLVLVFSGAAQPSLQFIGTIESGGYENNARSIVTDASGAIYMAGGIGGSTVDIDPGPGVQIDSVNAGSNPFMIKTDSSGNLLWKIILRCAEWSEITEIQADQQGNLLACGYFSGTLDLDPGPNTFDVTASSSPSKALFLVKLSAAGSFLWGKTIGTTGSCYPSALLVDDSSAVFLAGYFHGSGDFDPGPGQYIVTSGSKQGMFILRINSAGSFHYMRYFGEVSLAFVTGIAKDQNGGICAAGYFKDTLDIDPGAGLYNLISSDYGGFVTRLNNKGTFIAGGPIGGPGSSLRIDHLGRDISGHFYVGGTFNGMADMDPGSSTYTVPPPIGHSMFTIKYDSSWQPIWMAISQGSISTDIARVTDISVNATGNVYCTGIFRGNCDFDPGPGTEIRDAQSWDIFVQKLRTDGSLAWAINFGGTIDPDGHWPDDLGSSIAVRPGGKIITSGRYTYGTDFDPGPNTYSLTAFDGNLYLYILGESITITGLNVEERTSRHFWPNPSDGIVNFKTTFLDFLVYDATGKIVPVSTKDGALDLSFYPKGIYFCRFRDETRQTRYVKIIKE